MNPLIEMAGTIARKYYGGEELNEEEHRVRSLPLVVKVWSEWVRQNNHAYKEDILQDIAIESVDKNISRIYVWYRCCYLANKYTFNHEEFIENKEYEEIKPKVLPELPERYQKYEWVWELFYCEKNMREISEEYRISYGHIRNIWPGIRRYLEDLTASRI